MRSSTQFELQYAHRFYAFKDEVRYLHEYSGTLAIEVENDVNMGVDTDPAPSRAGPV